jgi:hypothetical protein
MMARDVKIIRRRTSSPKNLDAGLDGEIFADVAWPV